MWLDRFSNTSTPASSTPSRYRSPGPRRTSQLSPSSHPRNGLGIGLGRTSSTTSLDLASSTAGSNASLSLLQYRQTGSGLRQEQKPLPDVPDPTEKLQGLLGTSKKQDDNDDPVHVDFAALSLEEYVQQNDVPQDYPVSRLGTPKEKFDHRHYEDFHNSIHEADEVLKSVESYLTNFKAELGQVSAEIESLQARSVLLNAQLENRRKVERLLGPAVEDISLSPSVVQAVADGPVDDTFAKALTEIEARSLSVIEKIKGDGGEAKAAGDIKPILEDLKRRAVERIRDYLVAQIKSLRSPNINAQVIQQQSFSRHKELYPFLSRNNPQLAQEIGQAYANTMRWYYSSNFTRYNAALGKLQVHTIDLHDLLGSDPATRKQTTVLGTSRTGPPQHDAFNLGRRADQLKSKDDRALPSHLAEDSKTACYLEVPFQNFNRVLLDNLAAEYHVVTDFFSTNTFHQVSRRVMEEFEPTFAMGHALTKQLIENTTDCLGMLICIRLNQQCAFEAQKRKLPVMDDYINYTNILLWPRFQKAMDLHIDSLKKVTVPTNRGTAAAFSLVGGGVAANNTVAPHAITQRFGQFMHGIVSLSVNAGDDEPLAHSLSRLRAEYEVLMGKLSKGAGDASKRSRFLYNNYSLVLTIISDTQGKLAEEQKEHFGGLVRDHRVR